MKNHIKKIFIPVICKVKKKLIGALLVCAFMNTPLQAAEYFIDNPSVICRAHFKTHFDKFVTQIDGDFILEFDKTRYQTKRRWGFKYNGVLVGKNASMLLNWGKDEQFGILTVLANDYPCRATFSAEKLIQVVESNEAGNPLVDGLAPPHGFNQETIKNKALRAELDAIVNQKNEIKSSPEISSSSGDSFLIGPKQANVTELTSSQNTLDPPMAKPNLAKAPSLSITEISTNGPQGIVKGYVYDDLGVVELKINGRLVKVDNSGYFSATTFVPIGGSVATLVVFNQAGMSTAMSVSLERADVQDNIVSFEKLNPLGRNVFKNDNAVAIIVGVGTYSNSLAPAIYADTDARVFHDYALAKLGVPRDRIKTLVNDDADERGVLLAVMRWLARVAEPGRSDVYLFFAGHGLSSDDGQSMFLLPFDGEPDLLEKTAIRRDELLSDIASIKPRSVTVFLDTCYSGATRGSEMLIASRPISIRANAQLVPKNFTIITAAANDQTAKPLEEAKHGMFSYFLMKGMEGDADANEDNQITAGELHSYVQQNVIQQSSGSQTPELRGNSNKVLVRFQ